MPAPPPHINFYTLAKEYGYPKIRGDGTNRVPKCCKILKDGPAEKIYKELGIECIFTGITAAESRQRFMLVQRYKNKAQNEGISQDDPSGLGSGCAYMLKSGLTKVLPIAHWTEKDVWMYHDLRKMPHCKVYDISQDARVGCLPCTAYKSWEKRMSEQHYPTYLKVCKAQGIPIKYERDNLE